jgi:beta-lactamase regulating signal transducer with metallopeptidase domain
MLDALDGAERRVLVAHERAHASGAHYLFTSAARLAAAANPLLRPVSSAIDLAVERWADEDAAREAGDRTATARALLAAASAGPAGPQPGGALHAAQAHLPDRVACLLRRPAPHRLLATVLLAAAIAAWAAGCLLTGHVHALLELAEAA